MIVLGYSKLKELHRIKRDNYTDKFSSCWELIVLSLNINLNKLNTLKDEDIDTLTEGISRSLKALIKNK